MEWEDYREKFYYYAKYQGKGEEYIGKCLDYAEKLFKQGLPVIFDQTHLSLLIGYQESYLYKVSNSQEPFYREFKIPKKNKLEYRLISEPLPNLKNIQRWILKEILYVLEPSSYAKAFRQGYSIKDNARFHRNQEKLLTIDIQDYFGSINSKKVYMFFRSIGYANEVATMLANICTLKDSLPQGAPTSPMLSNLITKRLDKRISGFTGENGIRYTRYADDLTFSGDFQEGYIINVVKKILESEGFYINEKKTRVRKKNQRQEVTGIVVNEKMQASRHYRRKFRQKMHFIKKYGLESHVDKIGVEDKMSYLYHLLGIANFILNINPNDKETKEDYQHLKGLLSNH
jgi:RNA-directed DNA polymerase